MICAILHTADTLCGNRYYITVMVIILFHHHFLLHCILYKYNRTLLQYIYTIAIHALYLSSLLTFLSHNNSYSDTLFSPLFVVMCLSSKTYSYFFPICVFACMIVSVIPEEIRATSYRNKTCLLRCNRESHICCLDSDYIERVKINPSIMKLLLIKSTRSILIYASRITQNWFHDPHVPAKIHRCTWDYEREDRRIRRYRDRRQLWAMARRNCVPNTGSAYHATGNHFSH